MQLASNRVTFSYCICRFSPYRLTLCFFSAFFFFGSVRPPVPDLWYIRIYTFYLLGACWPVRYCVRFLSTMVVFSAYFLRICLSACRRLQNGMFLLPKTRRLYTGRSVNVAVNEGNHEEDKSRAITERTARCRCTSRYVYIEFYNGIARLLCHSTHFLLVFVCRLP